MCPRFSPAIAALSTHTKAGLSRWTHRVGVTRHPSRPGQVEMGEARD
jgi:hypothetical protein